MRYILAGLFALIATMGQAQEHDLRIDAGVSTLGLYIAPDIRFSDDLRVRAPLYYADFNRDFDVDGASAKGKLEVLSLAVMVDYYIQRSNFRASVGLSAGGYKASGTLRNPKLGDVTFNGVFGATLKQKQNVVPVLAVGYQRELGGSFGISAELGARLTTLRLTATGQENLPTEELRQSFVREIAKENARLKDLFIIPFFALGVTYKF